MITVDGDAKEPTADGSRPPWGDAFALPSDATVPVTAVPDPPPGEDVGAEAEADAVKADAVEADAVGTIGTPTPGLDLAQVRDDEVAPVPAVAALGRSWSTPGPAWGAAAAGVAALVVLLVWLAMRGGVPQEVIDATDGGSLGTINDLDVIATVVRDELVTSSDRVGSDGLGRDAARCLARLRSDGGGDGTLRVVARVRAGGTDALALAFGPAVETTVVDTATCEVVDLA